MTESQKLEKSWKFAEGPPTSEVEALAEALQVDEPIAWLLCHRKVCSFEQAREYFRPDLTKLHDPFLMKDMDKAVERLAEAISRGEHLLIYGDYDVDGTTAIALLYRFVSSLTNSEPQSVPDKFSLNELQAPKRV